MPLFPKRYHAPGTPPGTLHSTSEKETIRISLINYNASEVSIVAEAGVEACKAAISRDSMTWVRIQGQPTAELMQELGAAFDLHPLALEDVLNAGQSPKQETYDDQLFVVLYAPAYEDGEVGLRQVSIFLHKRFLLTFCPGSKDPFASIVKRLETPGTRARRLDLDYLFYLVLDLVIDQGFPVLESLGAQIEEIEEAIVFTPDRQVLNQIYQIKRNMILMRRSLWPQREVVSQLLRDEDDWIADSTNLYLRDCYDHTVQVMELVESYRDMSASLLDIYLSSVSMRLNDVMRVLTIIATIFIPLTFITGIYGMNFSNNTGSPWAMPELRWYYGYPLIWGVMIGVTSGMLIWFRRKRWI